MEFQDMFGKKPIIGMIHLTGPEPMKVDRAMEELEIYERNGLDGVIVKNFHGTLESVVRTLDKIHKEYGGNLKIGINLLPNEFLQSFVLADYFNCDFIQVDYVAGKYEGGNNKTLVMPDELFEPTREKFWEIVVLGGVWPKHYTPVGDSNLENDLREGSKRVDAVVVTGDYTGNETPIEKIEEFRRIIGDQPLIVGAGLTPENVKKQLELADGGIVGTYFKRNDSTREKVDEYRVRKFMGAVREVRLSST